MLQSSRNRGIVLLGSVLGLAGVTAAGCGSDNNNKVPTIDATKAMQERRTSLRILVMRAKRSKERAPLPRPLAGDEGERRRTRRSAGSAKAGRRAWTALVAIVFASIVADLQAQLRVRTQATGFTLPLAYVQDPTDRATAFVVQQGGRIRVVRNGAVLPRLADGNPRSPAGPLGGTNGEVERWWREEPEERGGGKPLGALMRCPAASFLGIQGSIFNISPTLTPSQNSSA